MAVVQLQGQSATPAEQGPGLPGRVDCDNDVAKQEPQALTGDTLRLKRAGQAEGEANSGKVQSVKVSTYPQPFSHKPPAVKT